MKISSSWAHLFLFLTNSFICFFLLVIVGEVANFAAYAFAPAILVTPLGALSVIVRYGTMLLCKKLFVLE